MSSSTISKTRSRVSFITAMAAVLAFAFAAAAAPMNGDTLMLSQPDGSEVPVVLFGDEYHMDAESVDGYSLVRGEDGWIYYADLSLDGSEYVSTGVRYTGAGKNGLNKSRPPVMRKGLRISEKSYFEKRRKSVKALGDGEEAQNRRYFDKVGKWERSEERKMARAAAIANGEILPAPDDEDEDDIRYAPRTVVGLAMFITFSDYQAPNDNGRFLTHANEVYNNPSYSGGSGAGYGSVYSYFQDVSNKQLDYTNYVSVWVQAPNTHQYYDGVANYGRVQELLTAVINAVPSNVASQIAAQVSRHTGTWGQKSRPMVAVNFHPIRSGQSWANGIWSHRGWYRGTATIGGVPLYDYQFSGLGNGTINNNTTLSTSVIIHENGHMLFDWPDLYSYVSGRTFINNYCTMANGTVMPNPFFRDLEGWITTRDLNDANGNSINGIATHEANSHTAFTFRRNGVAAERYYIEARFSNGRSSGIPGTGLIIWHVHTGGNNSDYDPNSSTAARRTPRVAVMQSNQNATWQSASGSGAPGANSPYNNTRNAFHSGTTPQAKWHSTNGAVGTIWAGPTNNLRITEVSAVPTASNPRMTFMVGTGSSTSITIGGTTPPATYAFTVTNGTGGGTFASGASVTATANNAASGQAFLRWTSTTNFPIPAAGVYASPITITTRAQADNLTANFGRNISIPGTVEADTSGYSTGMTRTAVSGASNGQAAAFSGNGALAEYIVNNTGSSAVSLQLAYRVQGTGTGARSFRVMRINPSNGNSTRIDTINVATTTLDTVAGATYSFPAGRSVLRVERTAGAFNLDQIIVRTPPPATFALTVANGGTGGGDYAPNTAVQVSAGDTRNNQPFIRWTSSSASVIPSNIYNREGSVTTTNAAVTLTPVYAGRLFAVPGDIEADSGHSANVTSSAVSSASGGRVGRFGDNAGAFAEFAVNIAAGSYQLRYSVSAQGTSTAARRFRVGTVNMSNGNITWIDTVSVSTTTALNTVTGRTRTFTAGRAVLRVERIEGTFNLDQIMIAAPQSSIRLVGKTPMAFDLKSAASGLVSYQVAKAEAVSVRIYDVRGREVAVIASGMAQPGYYNMNMASRLGRGVYIVRMQSESFNKNVRLHYTK